MVALSPTPPASPSRLVHEDPTSPDWVRGGREVASAALAISDPTLLPGLLAQAAVSSSPVEQSSRPSLGRVGRLVQAVLRIQRVTNPLEYPPDDDDVDRVITLDESEPAGAFSEREDAAISSSAQWKAAALVGFDAVTARLLRLSLVYPLAFMVLQARLRAELGCWSGSIALIRKLTPAGLYRGFVPLGLSVSLGELAAAAPSLLEFTTRVGRDRHERQGRLRSMVDSLPYRVAVLLPQIWLESLWARLVCCDTVSAAVAATTVSSALTGVSWIEMTKKIFQEAPLFSFSACTFLGVPLWLLAWQLTHGRRIATCGATPPWSHFVRLLPQSHPSYEGRGLLESIKATPRSGLLIALLHGMPQPDHRTQFRTFFPCVLPGLAVGAMGWLVAKTQSRKLRTWLLKRFNFEKPTQRLARKLALAQQHAHNVRARLHIETRSLLGDETVPTSRPKRYALDRLPSFKMKSEAARGLQPKLSRLISRLKAHARRARAAQAPEMRGIIPCLQIRRQSISASLRFVSHLPAVALEQGQLRIKFIDEPAVDVGGVFREFMGEMARTLSCSPLLAPANDGGLLPAHGQGARERRAHAAAYSVDLVVPLGKDGKLGCMLFACTTGNTQADSSQPHPFVADPSNGIGRSAEQEADSSSFPAFSVVHVEPDYPAASLLRQGDMLLGVNGCTVECGNTEQALSLIRQATMDSAPPTLSVQGAGFREANGTYHRLPDVVRGGGAPVYAKGDLWIARYLVRFSSPAGKRQAFVWFLQLADDGGDLYQAKKPFTASIPPNDGWTIAPGAEAMFSALQPPPMLEASGQCTVTLTVRRGPAPYNPAWREELYAIGRLMAISISTSTPLDVPFSRCIYKLLLAEPITADDVARIDVDFARHRVAPLLRGGGVAMMEELLGEELFFTGVPLQGSGEEQELLPGGASLRVNEENKESYISLLIEHYLVGHCREELAILTAGFHDLIPQSVLRDDCKAESERLSALELELIVAGLPSIDVKDWRRHTRWSMSGTVGDGERIIAQLEEWFFELLEAYSTDERATVLSFVCGSGRLPASGFAGLRPEFNIEVNFQEPTENLPTARTCFNQMCLPGYTTREQLASRLKATMRLGATSFGFV